MFDFFSNLFEDTVCIEKDVVVPETQNSKFAIPEVGIACAVVQAFRVLTAISFHNKPLVESNEINDPRPDRNLVPEFNAFKLTRTQ